MQTYVLDRQIFRIFWGGAKTISTPIFFCFIPFFYFFFFQFWRQEQHKMMHTERHSRLDIEKRLILNNNILGEHEPVRLPRGGDQLQHGQGIQYIYIYTAAF